MQLPFEFIEERFDRFMESMNAQPDFIPEDPVAQMLSALESHIENTVLPPMDPAPLIVLPPMTQPEKPTDLIKGIQSPNPPLLEEYSTGSARAHGAGGLRPSRAGIRNPSDVFCEIKGERIDHEECIDGSCEHWDEEIQICRYGEET